ncbi:hypothetical protein CAPTEDRAFT_200082 [Capitella teleta]|uniref:G-protein coupled receptors family 1 profile domain-containing protein n=1 Tax=Capitella teleta TaxID=283909 RepID=R7USI8_CAPTE|nr:hypothetical protein CAPTEDRAFT_200082 [Capitella teleta]|eukprot:ELU09078.1 hypothetical protein CAPTEDRAFT_200082 [Capitella teleta]
MDTATAEMPLQQMGGVQLTIVWVTLVFSCLTSIANPLTLVAMATNGLIRKNSINMFIASLCWSDFLVGLSAFLFQLRRLLQLGIISDEDLVAIFWVAAVPVNIGFVASIANAFLIGVDRACATLAPLSYRSRMTTRRAAIALVICWTLAILMVTACALTTVQLSGGFEMLTYSHELFPRVFIKHFISPTLIVSIATNAILYVVIVVAFHKGTNKIQPSSTFELRNRRMTRMITMVIGVLLLGNIPIVVVASLPATLSSNSEYLYSYQMMYDVSFLLGVIPTSLNNCIYVWQLPDFKLAFTKLLFCHRNSRVHIASGVLSTK